MRNSLRKPSGNFFESNLVTIKQFWGIRYSLFLVICFLLSSTSCGLKEVKKNPEEYTNEGFNTKNIHLTRCRISLSADEIKTFQLNADQKFKEIRQRHFLNCEKEALDRLYRYRVDLEVKMYARVHSLKLKSDYYRHIESLTMPQKLSSAFQKYSTGSIIKETWQGSEIVYDYVIEQKGLKDAVASDNIKINYSPVENFIKLYHYYR